MEPTSYSTHSDSFYVSGIENYDVALLCRTAHEILLEYNDEIYLGGGETDKGFRVYVEHQSTQGVIWGEL